MGRVTHTYISKLAIIGSGIGLLPRRRQATIWTSTGILLIGLLGTKFSKILIEIYTFSFQTMHLKDSSAKWRPFCLGLNVLKCCTNVPIKKEFIWHLCLVCGWGVVTVLLPQVTKDYTMGRRIPFASWLIFNQNLPYTRPPIHIQASPLLSPLIWSDLIRHSRSFISSY